MQPKPFAILRDGYVEHRMPTADAATKYLIWLPRPIDGYAVEYNGNKVPAKQFLEMRGVTR